MKVKHLFFHLLFLTAIFSACNREEEPAKGKYEKGIFVVNEGLFGGTGAITWHDPETGETEQDIFGKANDGAVLGEFVQSLTFHNGKGYICIGGGTKIVVVDAATFEFLDTIGGLSRPRYFLPYGNQFALVTQWGPDGNSGTVAKIDLTTNKVVQTSPVIGAGPDKMLQIGDQVVIANSGGFTTDSTLIVFRLSTFSVDDRVITGGKNPGMCVQTNSDVFVLCKGTFNDPVPQGWFGSSNDPQNGQSVPPYSEDLCASPDKNSLYFAGGGAIYQYKNGTLSTLIPQQAYGLACDAATGNLICTDAKDFNSAGEAIVYKTDGTKVESFPTGIAPGEIVIRN